MKTINFMKTNLLFTVTLLIFMFIGKASSQCGNFTNSITGVYYQSNNCNNIPPSTTATICATFNISLSTGNASYRLGYLLDGAPFYLTTITNVNSGSYSFNHCITFPCGKVITLMIETWSSPNGNGSQCPTYYSPPQSTLPVEIINFTLGNDQKNVKLNWTVANEIDIQKYIINKSYDGNLWFPIGEMQSINSKESLKHYSFVDNNSNSNVYYKLSILDYSGQMINSKIISSNISNEIAIVYPNPNEGVFKLTTKSEVINYQIINSIGEVVYSDNSKNVDISFLPEGIYYLKMVEDNQVIKILKK